MFDDNDGRGYLVVVNQEEQHSIWPDDIAVPAGWQAVGVRGSKIDCIEHIEQTWSDLRPLSLRRMMDETV